MVRLTFRKPKVRIEYPERPRIPNEPSLEDIERRLGQPPQTAICSPSRSPALDRTEEEEVQLVNNLRTAKSTEINEKTYVKKPGLAVSGLGAVFSVLIGAVELLDSIWNPPIDREDLLIRLGLFIGPLAIGALIDGMINGAAAVSNKIIKDQEMKRVRVESANRILNKGLMNQSAAKRVEKIANEPVINMTQDKMTEIRNGVYCAVFLSPIIATIAAVSGSDRNGNGAFTIFAATFTIIAAMFSLKVTRAIESEKKPVRIRVVDEESEVVPIFEEVESKKKDNKGQGTK